MQGASTAWATLMLERAWSTLSLRRHAATIVATATDLCRSRRELLIEKYAFSARVARQPRVFQVRRLVGYANAITQRGATLDRDRQPAEPAPRCLCPTPTNARSSCSPSPRRSRFREEHGMRIHDAERAQVLQFQSMKVFSAKIRGGAVVTDDVVDLPDGATVTIVADDEDGFDVTLEQEAELADAMDEADRGDLVSAAELLARLRS